MTDAIETKVIELAAEQAGFDPVKVTREHSFQFDLNFDSLDKVEFMMNLEDAFGISASDEEMEPIKTVGEAADYVRHVLTTTNQPTP